MPDYDVTEELQTHLVTAGLGQLPGATVSATIPSVWLDPKDGVPAPRGVETATITLRATHIGRPHDLDYAIEETFVDVTVRTLKAAPGKLLQRQIRGLLLPGSAVGGAKMVTIGGLVVEYLTQWRSDQALPVQDDTYVRVQSFRFGARRKALAGQPTLP